MTARLFDSLDEVAGRLALAPRIFLCLDFDGTLCPIVDDPAKASLPLGTQRTLATLAKCEQVTLAFLSGRERADLLARIGLPGLIYAGNHGLEISGPGLFFVEPTAASQVDVLHELAANLAARVQAVPGAFVEDKGLTLSVHYRQVDPAMVEEVRRIVHSVLGTSDHPFRLTGGDKVFDIRPRVDWNKGNAARWIKERASEPDALTIYIGDDTTDEEAFAALEDAITIKVGVAESTAARYVVDDPTAVLAFLEWLTEQVM